METQTTKQKKQEPKQLPLVTKTEEKALTTPTGEWEGVYEGIDKKDTLISKVLLMQPMSRLVQEKKAQPGDIVDSVSGKILWSSNGADLVFAPIKSFKTWNEVIKTNGGEKYKTYPMDATNVELPWEETVNGEHIKRYPTINVYTVLKDHTNGLPFLLSFRSTSFFAGKKVITHFTKCELAARNGRPVPPAATLFKLFGRAETKDKRTYYVFDVEPVGKTPDALLTEAWECYQLIRTGTTKVDETPDIETDLEADVEIKDEGRY